MPHAHAHAHDSRRINGIGADAFFFAFGDQGTNGVFHEMEMSVPMQNRWYELEPLPTAGPAVTGSMFVNGWIHLPGGSTSTGGCSDATIHQVSRTHRLQPLIKQTQ